MPVDPSWTEVLIAYAGLGFDHILEGIDHLLFVFALLLLVRDRWRLVGAITSFTVAHSITLAAATLGWVTLPSAPVEAVIALSVLFLAAEVARRDMSTAPPLSERFPWVVCFAFGLLHGFGFAGALSEIGLPPSDTPLALLAFNIGVEAGQLVFIAVVLTAGWAVRGVWAAMTTAQIPTGFRKAMCYPVGVAAAFWVVERVTAPS